MFNVVFTACAPLVVGWFDRDLDKGYGLRFPLLYKDGEAPGSCRAGVWVAWGWGVVEFVAAMVCFEVDAPLPACLPRLWALSGSGGSRGRASVSPAGQVNRAGAQQWHVAMVHFCSMVTISCNQWFYTSMHHVAPIYNHPRPAQPVLQPARHHGVAGHRHGARRRHPGGSHGGGALHRGV